MRYKNLFDKAEVEYITPFTKLWVSFNGWYKEDVKNQNFNCHKHCRYNKMKEHTDRCIIDYYKKKGPMRSEFLDVLELYGDQIKKGDEGLRFHEFLYDFISALQEYPLPNIQYSLVLKNSNRSTGIFRIANTRTQPQYSILDNPNQKGQFFMETLEIIYLIRNLTLHGNYNPADIYFQKVVEGAYKIFYMVLNKVLEKQEKVFFCTNEDKTVNAQGLLIGNNEDEKAEMLLLAGSWVALQTIHSYGTPQKQQERYTTLTNNAVRQNSHFELKQNIRFPSPSAASSFCLGKNSYGSVQWKTKSNKTLGYILRK